MLWRCMDVDNASLYAIGPILYCISDDPQNFAANFDQLLNF